jgi:hypothetical protein
MTVTGTVPLAGFELWHAPFSARAAQYLYATVPSGYSPGQVSVSVDRSGGGYSKMLNGETVDGKQRFLLRNVDLPSGDYVVTVTLAGGGSGKVLREKFTKSFAGAPAVGIDENNSFVFNGSLFFPVTTFQINTEEMGFWKTVTNTNLGEGYYANHTPTSAADFLVQSGNKGYRAIAPVRWEGGGMLINPNPRNSDLTALASYPAALKNSAALFGWCPPSLNCTDSIICLITTTTRPPMGRSWTMIFWRAPHPSEVKSS